MGDYKIISGDDHVYEPADLWTTRVDSKFKDRVPRIESLEDGDWWICDGKKGNSAALGVQVGRRFEEPEKLTFTDKFENVRLGGYIPDERIKDMELDGLDVTILYPTAAFVLYTIVPDSELLTVIFKTYNDWLAEFCQAHPKRLKGIGMLNTDDVETSIKELERCAKLGMVGAMVSLYPPLERQYDRDEYEPLWAAAQDLGIPISLHIGTNRPGPGQEASDLEAMSAAYQSNVDHWVRMSLARMIFSGVFERYPKLQVGSIEMELSWVPHFLDRIDYTYTNRVSQQWYKFKGDALPSDFFHSNVFLGFQEDALGVRYRHLIGVEKLQWGSDYPHFESTFPRSREILEELLTDCNEEEKAMIAGGNAARVYNLN